MDTIFVYLLIILVIVILIVFLFSAKESGKKISFSSKFPYIILIEVTPVKTIFSATVEDKSSQLLEKVTVSADEAKLNTKSGSQTIIRDTTFAGSYGSTKIQGPGEVTQKGEAEFYSNKNRQGVRMKPGSSFRITPGRKPPQV